MPRIFVGLAIPEALKNELLLLRGGIEGARWQEPEQYHLTLRFIGDVAPPLAHELPGALGRLEASSFSLALKGVGIFGETSRPRLLWAGVADPEPVMRLHNRIDRLLVDAGFEPDGRRFKPHVTLARFSGRAGRVELWLLAHAGLALAPFQVDEVVMFESHLGHEAAHYTPIARFPLRRVS